MGLFANAQLVQLAATMESLRAAEVRAAAAETSVTHLERQIAEMRASADAQIAKLEAQVLELRREALRVTDDVLISMGIRHPASTDQFPAEVPLSPAKSLDDKLDDEISGMGPIDWQETAEHLEFEAFRVEQQQELIDYIAERKRAKGVAGAPTIPSRTDPVPVA